MDVGPHDDTNRRAQHPAGSTLFDRIARDIAATATAFPADETSELVRRDADDSGPGGIVIDRRSTWPAPDVSTQIERPSISERQCARTGCSDAAAVTLSYQYATSHVWIDHLSPEREPHLYDMCERHAARLSVPRGWHLDDRRTSRTRGLIAV